MAFTSTSDSICQHLNSTTILQSENFIYMREVTNIVSKKLSKTHLLLKLKRKAMYPIPNNFQLNKLCRNHITAVPIPTTSIVSTCYPYQQDYSYPLPIYTVQPFPIIAPRPRPIFATRICPFARTVVQPFISQQVVPQTFVQEDVPMNIFNYINEFNFSAERSQTVTEVANKQTYYLQEEAALNLRNTAVINTDIDTVNIWNRNTQYNSLENYLTLPRELFPPARTLAIDPNPIIDAFCKMPNVQCHTSWLLDLEFGVPRTPVTRPIPIYNVKFNSINCRNAPNAVHPGFESCDPDFKKILLFYYDCIVSTWYSGYIVMSSDRSVENFQSWLLPPMQVLGMCWP